MLELLKFSIVMSMNDNSAQQDPLTALEDVLKTTQQQSAKGGQTVDQADSSTTEQLQKIPIAEAKQRQELTELETKQDQEDSTAIEQKMSELQELTQAHIAQENKTSTQPTNDASVDQSTAIPAASTEDPEGYQIRQLDHDKIAGES